MAFDYASLAIRVNCICRATIQNTKLLETSLARIEDRAKQLDYLLAKPPDGAVEKPGKAAYTVPFLGER